MDGMFMNELIVNYKVATCHYTVAMSCNCIDRVLPVIISDLQFMTSNYIISMKDLYDYKWYVVRFAAF